MKLRVPGGRWKITAEESRESFPLLFLVAASEKEFRRFFADKIKTAALELNHRHDIQLP